jgi:NAD-dependent dihydropyrimidine dehydrogenase PreA subunit
MTHDELLEAVNSPTYRQSRTLEHPYIALRAVLELHKPMETNYIDIETCTGCEEAEYPCPTIQAIEKELK